MRGFQHQKFEYFPEKLIWTIKRKEFRCPRCGSLKVQGECVRVREIQGLPFGRLLVYFKVKIHRLLRKKKLKVVAMDMSNAYPSWVEKHFSRARIVFDHFHVIKLMNNRLDALRRRYISQLDASQRDQFKRLRMLFLRNMEDQNADGQLILSNMRKHFQELGDAYMLKEALRSIYATAKNALDARAAFKRWATLATQTGSKELIAMAKTIREKLPGIITNSTFDRLSNASTEGFNNKIRWLMRLAYGFRDVAYLKLKIFQLPSIQPQKEL